MFEIFSHAYRVPRELNFHEPMWIAEKYRCNKMSVSRYAKLWLMVEKIWNKEWLSLKLQLNNL